MAQSIVNPMCGIYFESPDAPQVKRCLDMVTAFLLLALFAPLAALVALLVKLTSEGPVLYWQTRVGKDGRKPVSNLSPPSVVSVLVTQALRSFADGRARADFRLK